jgi:putative hydrolase of the HAD superfamily
MAALVTFDLWETLIYDEPDFGVRRREMRLAYVHEALVRFGWQISRDQLVAAHDHSWAQVRKRWLDLVDVDVPEQIDLWLAAAGDGHPKLGADQRAEIEHLYVRPFLDLDACLLPGAHACVAAARDAGFTIGLISNTGRTPGWALAEGMSKFGLRELFDFTLFSNEVGWRKPSARVFERAAEIAGTRLGLHVGDNYEADVLGAHGAGWQTIWIAADGADGDRTLPAAIWAGIAEGADWFSGPEARRLAAQLG